MTGDDIHLAGDPADDEAIRRMPRADLELGVAALPAALRAPARAVLLQGRSYSDASQDLGIRQAELVRALQRARSLILRGGP